MTAKFGGFVWKRYKDVKPEDNMFVYTYFPDSIGGVDISLAEDIKWGDDDYWCYVYIPDAPLIQREFTLEDKINMLEQLIDRVINHIDPLRQRF